MTMPTLPPKGSTDWFPWATAAHAAASEVTTGRLTDASLRAAFEPVFTPEKYGAVADGITDSSAAIQNAINAASAAGGGIVHFPGRHYLVNTALTFPAQKVIRLRGTGFSSSGNIYGTRLIRTGTNLIVDASGTGMDTSLRIYPEFENISFNGGGTPATVVRVQRATHALFDRVRINNSAGTGLHLTEVWDSHFPTLIIEACGNGTTAPALLLDSVVGAGADACCATLQFGSLILQSNFGTDMRLTGSAPDGAICNDVEVALLKAEGKGNGTSGAPDTYPYLDLDYAQNCQFAVVRVSVPTGRAPTAVLQQIGTTGGGPRANQFGLLTLDVAGSNSPERYIDHASGGLTIGQLNMPSNLPTVEYIRARGARGRLKIAGINHNSTSPFSGFITDTRAIAEEPQKGHIKLFPPRASGSATATTVGNATAYAFADAASDDCTIQIVIPRDAHGSGQCRVRLLWTSAATTGVCHWRVTSKAYAAGADTTAAGVLYETLASAPTAANALQVTTLGNGPTPAPGGLLTVYLQRMGALEDDTMAGSALLLAAELTYDRL